MSQAHCSVRAMAAARENAHAKVEQEAAIARHRARLVGRGLLDDAGGEAWLVPRRLTLDESVAAFEVESTILAAQARVDVSPHALAEATGPGPTVRRRRPAPPPRDPDAAARAAAAGFGASAVIMPRLPSRNRYWESLGAAGAGGGGPPAPAPHPAVADAARRATAAASRAGAYGSGVGLLIVAGLALGGAHYVAPDGGAAARGALDGVRGVATAAVAPVAAAARAWLAVDEDAPPSEFAGDLGRRLERRVRRAAGVGGREREG